MTTWTTNTSKLYIPAHCIKCGCEQATVTYCEKSEEKEEKCEEKDGIRCLICAMKLSGSSPTSGSSHTDEHLTYVCGACGYAWEKPPKDTAATIRTA